MPRPTTRTIAKELGLSNATVSMALRQHPRVSAKTRERVRDAAREMGYFRDPSISKLMTRIRSSKPMGEMTTVALLNANPIKKLGAISPYHEQLLKGMLEQGMELGYQIEPFWLNEASMPQRRMSQILESRGIQGIIIPPISDFGKILNFNWEAFSVVTIGYSLLEPRFNRVVGNQRQAIFNCLQKLLETGHKRIGAVWHELYDARLTFITDTVYMWFQQKLPESRRIPLLKLPESMDGNDEILSRWLQSNRPDAIITHDPTLCETFERLGYPIPDDFSIVNQGAIASKDIQTGYRLSSVEIGHQVVKMLDSQLQQNVFGIPEFPITSLVDMQWTEGKTLKRRGPPDPLAGFLGHTAW
jgi:LacI family transcriptional regulator